MYMCVRVCRCVHVCAWVCEKDVHYKRNKRKEKKEKKEKRKETKRKQKLMLISRQTDRQTDR